MKQKPYVIGGRPSTGHKIASILGQVARGCVYTKANKELRGVYWHNNGTMSAHLKDIVARFDTLMPKIAASPALAETRRARDLRP